MSQTKGLFQFCCLVTQTKSLKANWLDSPPFTKHAGDAEWLDPIRLQCSRASVKAISTLEPKSNDQNMFGTCWNMQSSAFVTFLSLRKQLQATWFLHDTLQTSANRTFMCGPPSNLRLRLANQPKADPDWSANENSKILINALMSSCTKNQLAWPRRSTLRCLETAWAQPRTQAATCRLLGRLRRNLGPRTASLQH